ncbi:ferric reductase-like protein transmembrane component 4 [Pyrenochaeta sp. DS3sAY3a]|nr:ferric reductase-like protein transmembrane component 4 [Pyrenochaeta sp. DS3sAY3a]
MVQSYSWLALALFTALSSHIPSTEADGTGLIGYGKTLYDPTCPFACRSVIRKQKLSCTPTDSTQNHGTAHNPVTTPPKCFIQDPTFLKTMALCIDTYCPLSDKPTLDLIHDYWAAHLGTGTIGNYNHIPSMTYEDALAAARDDESKALINANMTTPSPLKVLEGLITHTVSSPLGFTTGGSAALNSTKLVSPVQWQLQWNYLSDFEVNEKGHSTMTITICVVAITLPIVLSLLRFIPFSTRSHPWSYLKSFLVHPALFGRSHREPLAGGLVPTRGQALYIFVISFINLILLIAPFSIKQPQASFASRDDQLLSVRGNRAGTMALGNVIALILFSSRNNFLLYLTDWSYSTYLLLHRWLGYWAVLHTIIHSAMLWRYYDKSGGYAAEFARLYWSWGIVGTVAACALIPLSILQIRQKLYEFFIVAHVVLTFLFLLGYYLHIWYVYTWNWGYEILAYVAFGIWALDRVARIIRMAANGSRSALLTVVPDTDGEYLRINLNGSQLHSGVAYLGFPTLSWRFWETHPFSICGPYIRPQDNQTSRPRSGSRMGPEISDEQKKEIGMTAVVLPETATHPQGVGTTFYARTRGGLTQLLANKATTANGQIRLRVLIDGPYEHSGNVKSSVSQCSSIVCIAGGVGITACFPFLRANEAKEMKLFFSSRKTGLITDLLPALDRLPNNVTVETVVGLRLNVSAIILQALLVTKDNSKSGPVAVIVSGPPSLADAVRFQLTTKTREYPNTRPFVLVDEAFGW